MLSPIKKNRWGDLIFQLARFFIPRLAVPGTEGATPFDDPNAQQLFSDIGSSMMSLPLGFRTSKR